MTEFLFRNTPNVGLDPAYGKYFNLNMSHVA